MHPALSFLINNNQYGDTPSLSMLWMLLLVKVDHDQAVFKIQNKNFSNNEWNPGYINLILFQQKISVSVYMCFRYARQVKLLALLLSDKICSEDKWNIILDKSMVTFNMMSQINLVKIRQLRSWRDRI